MDLQGKCVLLGVTGGIAAYKMANVASALKKLGADVEVIMTQNATQFITPLTFETLTGHKCMVDTFDRDFKFEVTHISLAKKADVILVAPATANVIAKLAHGQADDMLTTATYAQRIAFVCEIAGRLHRYGTTAQRLEGTVVGLSQRLGLDCEPWSNPTGLILSFSDPTRAIGSSDITRVIRLGPGDTNLHKLAMADQIVVLEAGRIVEQGAPASLRASQGRYARFLAQRRSAKGWRIAAAALDEVGD